MNKLIMTLALAATVALSGCAKRSEIPVTADPVEAVRVNHNPPAIKAGTPVEVTETAVANCVAETRKLPDNKDLPKKLSGFRRLAAGTEATLADCAGGEKVLIQYLVDDDGKVVGHESLWGEVRTALEASALAQTEPDTTARDAYIAAYNDGVKDAKATAAKQARADKAVALAAAKAQKAKSDRTLLGLLMVIVALAMFAGVVITTLRRRNKKPIHIGKEGLNPEPAPAPAPTTAEIPQRTTRPTRAPTQRAPETTES